MNKHLSWWASNSEAAITPWCLIRCITNVFRVHSSAPIFHPSLPSSWFLLLYLLLHHLSSLSSVFLLLFSSLSLSSSWLGEITPPHWDTLSSLAKWWNTGHQSNAALLVVVIMRWGIAFIWFYRSRTVLIHPTHPTYTQKHTSFWCVCTIAPFLFKQLIPPFHGVIRFVWKITQHSHNDWQSEKIIFASAYLSLFILLN